MLSASNNRRRLERLERAHTPIAPIDVIRVRFVEPSPNGPIEGKHGFDLFRQPDGSFGDRRDV